MSLLTMPRAPRLAAAETPFFERTIGTFLSAAERVSQKLVEEEHESVRKDDDAPMSHEDSFQRFMPMKRLLSRDVDHDGNFLKRRRQRAATRRIFRGYLSDLTNAASRLQRARGTIGHEDSQLIFVDTIRLLYWIGGMHASWMLHVMHVERSGRLAISAFERIREILHVPAAAFPAN